MDKLRLKKKASIKKNPLNVATFLFFLIIPGCGKEQKEEGKIIPESNLPLEEQEKIREVAEMSWQRWSSGYIRILWALTEITGEPLSESTGEIEYWQKWWEGNKSKYQ